MSDREKEISIVQYAARQFSKKEDLVAIEEPLEIRVVSGPEEKRRGKSLAITMRTPGHDEELALGFMFTEGIVNTFDQIRKIEFCGPVEPGGSRKNTIEVELTFDAEFDLQHLQRHFYTTSSCGVCGKASLDALKHQKFAAVDSKVQLDSQLVSRLPEILKRSQDSFQKTGGIHAAGLFDSNGQLLVLREDVGRHNALDKLIGQRLRSAALPASDAILVVSGRASFELLQKTLSAGIPIFIAVGAPSSLAVDLANEFNITLVGFASPEKFNVYTHPHRILPIEGVADH